MLLGRLPIASLAFLVMESLVWYAIATVLAGGAGGSGPAYVTVLLAALGGFGLTRVLQRLDLAPSVLVAIGAGMTVLALSVLLNLQYNLGGSPLSFSWLSGFAASPDGFLETRWPQTWGVLIVCAAWFRAVWAAQQDFRYSLVLTSFSIGLIVIVVTLLFGQSTRAGERVNLAALPFFLSGLLTLSIVQLQNAEGGAGGLARGPWLRIVLGTVAALGLASAALGLFPLSLFNRLLAPVGMLLLRLLDLVILLIALPISWLVALILGRILGQNIEWPQPTQVASDNAERIQQQGERSGLISFLIVILQFLFVLAVLALVAYILYRVFRHLRSPTRGRDEVRESVEAEGSLGDDLNALLRGLLRRFARGGGRPREPELPEGARRVRRLYLELLDDAAARGTTRPPPATPREFEPDLAHTYGAAAPTRLSDRFIAARYGRVEPSPDELMALERELSEAKRQGT